MDNRIGAIIQCRYNSSRLPGKILKQISGSSILDVIVTNLEHYFQLDQVIIATSDEATDDLVYEHCQVRGYQVFRGSLNDVSKRFLDASKAFNLDFALRVNGDNYFMNGQLLEYFFQRIQNYDYDLITNVPGRSFGYGMSLELVNMKMYETVIAEFTDEEKEHVTKHLYDHPTNFKICEIMNEDFPFLAEKKLAIDTQEDFANAIEITEKLGTQKFSLESLNNYFSQQ